ncbi:MULTISPECIES: N-acetylglucosamine kinase [Kocuria]|uniref:N-acetylglucosamine kinase n=1 Tax=Kocuria TaxID=57493 RepID=UPI001F6134D5|nr:MULTISPECIES: BadF/BadG/BcrA/BcrD ATPase family protein [Kocuria]MDT0118891.1 BadF/BadG/BcrA/BcrD ATPase family protein [Kocuria sp. PD6]
MNRFLVGLDIGGSHTRGVLFRGDSPVREARSGSANVQNVSRERAAQSLREIFARLEPPPGTTVLAGAGGVDTPHDAAALTQLIRSVAEAAAGAGPASETPVIAVHDTRLILAAGGHTEGIAAIAGTGSVAWGVNASGHGTRAGGWGYLLGDEGSGYWLGREAVRHVLRDAQHRGASDETPAEDDRFARAVLGHAGVDTPTELIAAFHDRPDRTHWAGLARTVIELAPHDDAARELVSAAAAHLAELIITVARNLGEPLPVVMGGGLATTSVGVELRERLGDHGLRVTLLDREPVLGAPLLARATGLWDGRAGRAG